MASASSSETPVKLDIVSGLPHARAGDTGCVIGCDIARGLVGKAVGDSTSWMNDATCASALVVHKPHFLICRHSCGYLDVFRAHSLSKRLTHEVSMPCLRRRRSDIVLMLSPAECQARISPSAIRHCSMVSGLLYFRFWGGPCWLCTKTILDMMNLVRCERRWKRTTGYLYDEAATCQFIFIVSLNSLSI